jgi:hypothetical protein
MSKDGKKAELDLGMIKSCHCENSFPGKNALEAKVSKGATSGKTRMQGEINKSKLNKNH